MHSINIILFNEDQLRNSKIDSIVDNQSNPLIKIKHKRLPKGIIALPEISVGKMSKYFENGFRFVLAETDYFGGAGEQSAEIFEISDGKSKSISGIIDGYHPINEALKKIGVQRESGMDEFDTIDLGKYRTNNDFAK